MFKYCLYEYQVLNNWASLSSFGGHRRIILHANNRSSICNYVGK